MEAGLVAKVRLEEGIPKLLVKVSPVTAANNAKNLGEVSLRKHGVAVARSHVAVVHISAQVPQGVVLISTKLAELLEVTEGEQVHIARSERVSRHTPGKEEVLGGSMRHQSKMGSVPPEVKARMPWTEQSPLFIQPDRVAPRRTVHGGRLFQAKPEEMEPPPHQRVISRSFSNQMHVPQQTFHPPGQRPMPSPKATYPYAYMPQTRSVTQCHAPGTARPSAKLIPGAKVASPKVQSARSRPYEAQPADWLPSSFAVYQRPPPSSPPALILRKAESRSPSPPRTPLRTYEKSPAASPPAPAAFVRSVSEDAASSPSPPLLTRMVRPQAKQYPKEAQVYYPPMRMVSAPRAEVKVVERRRSTDRPLLEPGTIPSPCESPPERCPEPPERPQIRLSSMPVTQTQSERRGSQLLRHETIERPLQAAEDVERPIPSREDRESKVLPPLPSFPPPADGVAAMSRGGSKEMALVPVGPRASERRGMRYKSLGALQCESQAPQGNELAGLDASWRPPSQSAGGSLERSELGGEITVEVRRWLHGGTSGLQCSHVVMDKALTVLSNFKLSSGCELEVLGGPLGAIIGGYNEEDWLYQEIFSKAPGQALKDAFELLGFPAEGDWSNYMVEEISLAYRRQCLRGHPSRGGSARHYLKLQVAMELVRAFGSEDDTSPRHGSFVLDDVALARELHLSPGEAAQEADQLPTERLEEINRALDEYILRQMCFKSEIVAEIARLHENSAYSILGVSPDASDSEIKKAYRLVAMQCHPDKGGDKAEFQELHEAYEKIMEQRRSSANLEPAAEKVEPKEKEKEKEPEEPKVEKEEAEEAEVEEESAPGDEEEDGTDAQLLAKSAKAAEEASRYAKTAADFAHQAAEAAETARNGAESNALALTKSIAHSAIVLTLTVVKAVRVVGYATMDVAAQCRLAARKFQDEKCTECSTEAMGLGLEALNAALSCAEVTEVTAAELSREDANAEGYVGAAVSASLAAASASNAAMSAAIAAVEGNRQCIQAAQPADPDPEPEEKSPRSESERSERSEPKVESPEDAGLKRQLTQRNNNHKVLQRLNAEILTHQQNVRQFLQANRQLIPEVSCEAKGKVQKLLQDYAREVQQQIQRLDGDLSQELPGILKGSGLLAPLLQGHVLAIPVCPKARVLKMATLYDLQSTLQVIDEEIFEPARLLLAAQGQDLGSFEELVKQVHEELRSYTEGA